MWVTAHACSPNMLVAEARSVSKVQSHLAYTINSQSARKYETLSQKATTAKQTKTKPKEKQNKTPPFPTSPDSRRDVVAAYSCSWIAHSKENRH